MHHSGYVEVARVITATRRAFLMSAVALLVTPVPARAQQAGKVYRIGWLGVGSRGAAEHLLQAFEQALREHGWVTGKNVVIESRWAEGRYDQLRALADELVRLEPHAIVGAAMAAVKAVKAAKDATSTVPIVMVTVTDASARGSSRASPAQAEMSPGSR